MRLAYISDQKFFIWEGRWFTTASFPLDKLADLFPFIKEWVIYGRLYALTEKPTDLYEIPAHAGVAIMFQGPRNMARGIGGYLGWGPWYFFGAYAAIVSSDVVWLKLPFVASLAYLTVFPKRRRIVFCQMVGDPETAAAKQPFSVRVSSAIYKHLVKLIVSKCNFAVFVSEYLARKYRCPRTPSLVANESRITEEMFAPPRDSSPHQTPRVLFVGRLSREKGLTTLFAALARLKDQTSFEAWIIGSGNQLTELTDLAVELGIKQYTRFLGQIEWGSQLFSIMRETDVLVLPSTSEGLPLVLVEAMSQGLPVVATAVGGIPEVIENRVSGLLVPPDSPDDLAEAIMEAISDLQLRDTMIAHGFEVARRNTFGEQTGKIAHTVQQLIDATDRYKICPTWRNDQ